MSSAKHMLCFMCSWGWSLQMLPMKPPSLEVCQGLMNIPRNQFLVVFWAILGSLVKDHSEQGLETLLGSVSEAGVIAQG